MKQYKLRIKGPGGSIETLVEDPEGARAGLALIAHPHPLHGGTLDNKVVWTIAKTALECGYVAVRPNFRGVGASDGEYDHGIGETDDLLTVAETVGTHFAGLNWSLLGFSFGAYVQHRLSHRLPAERLVMVGPAVGMYAFEPPAIRTDIVHGEEDELIPLGIVQDYAQLHGIPLQIVPGAGHFFHGKLGDLKRTLLGLCRQPL